MKRRILLLLASLIAMGAIISAGPPASADHGGNVSHYNYTGVRFYDMTAKTCVEDRANVVKDAGKSKYIRYAVEHVNRLTAAKVYYKYGKGSCAGTGYKYRVIITDANYDNGYWLLTDRGGKCTDTKKSGCYKWGKTINGHSTWLQSRYVAIRLDIRWKGYKIIPGNKRPWVHELGHAVLGIKDYPTSRYLKPTCNSIMAYCYPSDKTGLHKNDITWFNAIRRQ